MDLHSRLLTMLVSGSEIRSPAQTKGSSVNIPKDVPQTEMSDLCRRTDGGVNSGSTADGLRLIDIGSDYGVIYIQEGARESLSWNRGTGLIVPLCQRLRWAMPQKCLKLF